MQLINCDWQGRTHQCCGSGSSWILMDPHHFENMDPHPHQIKKIRIRIHIRIRIKVISWNRIWVRINLQLTRQNVRYGIWAYLSTFSRVWAFIWKVGFGSESGPVSGWKVGYGSAEKKSKSASNKKRGIQIHIRICINVMQIQHWNTQKNNSLERAHLRNSGICLISYPGFLLICAGIHAHVGPGHVLRPPGRLRALLAPARLTPPRAVLQHQRYEGTQLGLKQGFESQSIEVLCSPCPSPAYPAPSCTSASAVWTHVAGPEARLGLGFLLCLLSWFAAYFVVLLHQRYKGLQLGLKQG